MSEAKLWFWILLDVAIAMVVVIGGFVGIPFIVHWGNSLSPARTVTVTAQGKTTATPNLAELSFSVVSQGQDPQSLESDNDTQMNSVMQFLSQQGIATSDIQTLAYDLEPNYQYPKDSTQGTIAGYTLTQTVQVKVRDLTNVASVLGGLPPLGVNQIGSVNFTFDDETSFLAAARADAMTNAQQEAEQMAQGFGATLGPIVNVNENNQLPGPEPVYSYASAGSGMAVPAAVNPTVQPGSEDVTDNVTVTYALQ
jgi:uncharacterized protein YggE